MASSLGSMSHVVYLIPLTSDIHVVNLKSRGCHGECGLHDSAAPCGPGRSGACRRSRRCADTESGPRDQKAGSGEARHVHADLRRRDAGRQVTDPGIVAGKRARNQASPAASHGPRFMPRGRTCPMVNYRVDRLSALPRVRPLAGPAARMPRLPNRNEVSGRHGWRPIPPTAPPRQSST